MLKQKIQGLGVQVAEIIAKTWVDKKFKEQLLKDPKNALKEWDNGFSTLYKNVEAHDFGKDQTLHLSLIYPPSELNITESDLKNL